MEKKVLNQTQVAIIKRIAQNANGNNEKIAKLNDKISALIAERDSLASLVEEMELPVKRMTGGFTSGDLVEKVVTPVFNEDGTPKVDTKTGYQLKKVQYVLRYPESILPPVSTEAGNTATTESATEVENN